MKLRKLKQEDAVWMLEWMHNKTVVEKLHTNFEAFTIENCQSFIVSAANDAENMHRAIVDDNDIYMGTVSLKHITDTDAEFAIVIREKAMGKGYAQYGMKEIVRIGIEQLNLKKIYWCVDKENVRAVKFYEKNGYQKIDLKQEDLYEKVCSLGIYEKVIEQFFWYLIKKH